MKTIKTLALSMLLALVSFGFVGTAQAATASLYVFPASATKNVGDTLAATIGVNPAGNTVYAVEGTLKFDKLTCLSITVTDGVQIQSAPSCANPHFLLGLASGATVNKSLMTVVTKAGSAGTATISISGVDVIGEGVSLSTSAGSGNYTIESVNGATDVASPTDSIVTKNATSDSNSVKKTTVNATKDTAKVKPTGEVLAGFDEQTTGDITKETESCGVFSSSLERIIIGFLVFIILGLAGYILFKKKK